MLNKKYKKEISELLERIDRIKKLVPKDKKTDYYQSGFKWPSYLYKNRFPFIIFSDINNMMEDKSSSLFVVGEEGVLGDLLVCFQFDILKGWSLDVQFSW